MAKIIHQNTITGQAGINLIATVVTNMGYLWTSTNSSSDAGIDGFIEVRDPATGEASNRIVQVQSKATQNGREWTAETGESFDYLCDERDLDYWLQGNAPVILIISKPSENTAYWVSVKDYFHSLELKKARKVRFSKKKDLFTIESAGTIARLSVPRDAGIYLAPPPKTEILYSNLLPVARYASTLYVGETSFRKLPEIWAEFKKLGVNQDSEWILKNERIFSLHNLKEFPFNKICDAGSVEEFKIAEWAESQEVEKKRDFVQLLNLSLKVKLGRKGVRFFNPKNGYGLYYFAATRDLCPRELRQKSLRKEGTRTVFQPYPSKKDPTRIAYYRHFAFEPKFLRFEGTWFLEITPTYFFTSDGRFPYKYGADLLKGIKKIEKNLAVLRNVLTWANFLGRPEDLFAQDYKFLEFASLVEFDVEFGIRDEEWISLADPEEKEMLDSGEESNLLF